ncbi:MAG: hypothetical protein KTR30_18395 [Saprospiraceae bacterium]|nr:hypothetical protein [Saprospiraceae bacterium]
MAFDEEKHRKIEDYLGKKLKGESRNKFEQDMLADEELSKEVELHRDMEELLSDSPENALRKNLSLLGQEVKTEPNRKPSRWGFALLIPLFLAVVWWFWTENSQLKDTNTIPEIEEVKPAIPDEDLESEPSRDAPLTPPTQEETAPPPTKPTTPAPSPGRKRGQREPAPRAIAANFVPNPSLEFLIENNLRDTELSVKLTKKQQKVQLTAADAPTPFQISLQLQSREDISQQDFKLHLFSNDRQAFDDFSPIATTDLTIVPIEGDIYQINFSKSYSLEPGLYYYVIEDFSEEKIHLVEKFEVE